MVWKTVIGVDGDATHFGGEDTSKISNLFNGVLNVDTVVINSAFKFQNGKLEIRNVADSFSTTFASTITGNHIVTLRDSDGTMAYLSDIAGFASLTDIKIHPTFIIYKSGANYIAKNGDTGAIDSTNTDAKTVIQYAIDNLPAGGGKIEIKAGTYPLASTLNINKDDVIIEGAGRDVTRLECASSLTASEAIIAGGSDPSVSGTLTADGTKGTNTVQMSNAHGANFSIGDYVLLKSTKQIDSTGANFQQGEIHVVIAIAVDTPVGGTTTVTLNDNLYDTYTTAATGKLQKLTIKKNISISNLTFSNAAGSNTTNWGDFIFRWIDGLVIQNCEYLNGWYALNIQSCINVQVNNYSAYNVQGGSSISYGIRIMGAMQNCSITNYVFKGKGKHALTTGAIDQSLLANGNGMPRNVAVVGAVSYYPTGGNHFNTHEPGENISFVGCTCIGGIIETLTHQGFYIRTPRTNITGCNFQQMTAQAIFLDPLADGCVISGCVCDTVYRDGAGNGGRFIEAGGGCIDVVVSNNYVANCERQAIFGATGCNGWVITGNRFVNNNTFSANAAVNFSNSNKGIFTGNYASGSNSKLLILTGTSDDWMIQSNYSDIAETASSDILGNGHFMSGNRWVATDMFSNVPSGATFSWQIARTVEMSLSATQLDLNNNSIVNATLNLTSNTLSGTKAQFDTALSNDNFAYLDQGNQFTQDQQINRTGQTALLVLDRNEILADGTTLGTIEVSGSSDSGVGRVFGRIQIKVGDDVNTAEDGTIVLQVKQAGADVDYIKVNDASGADIDMMKPVNFNSQNVSNMGTLNTHTIPAGTSTFEIISNKNIASGYAGLDGSSRIAKAQGHSATVYSDQANVYTGGMKQTFDSNATTAGLRDAGHTADPSTLVDGDIFYNTTSFEYKYRSNATTRTFAALDATQTFTNKTFDNSNIFTIRDDRLTLQDDADTTKQAVFQLSGITTGTTRTYTMPNASGTIVITGLANQIGDTEISTHTSTKITITAKGQLNSSIVYTDQANTYGAFDQIFKDSNFKIVASADATKIITFDNSGMTTAKTLTIKPLNTTTQILQLPNITATDTVVALALAQSPTNKTFDNTNIFTIRDDRFTLQDDADTTKQTVFQLSGITTGTTRTLTVPNASGTIIITGLANQIGDTEISAHTSTKITITNHTHLPSTIVYTDQANTYTAGFKQSFDADATNADIRLIGHTADPSSLSAGDMWYQSTAHLMKYRGNATTRTFVNTDEAQTLTTKTFSLTDNTVTSTSIARGDVVVANSTPKFERLVLGTASKGFRSDGTDALWEWEKVATKTTDATLVDDEEIILLNPSTTAITMTLPASSGRTGKHYKFFYIASTGTVVTIDGNASETINGLTTIKMEYQYSVLDIWSDGTNWYGQYLGSVYPPTKLSIFYDDFLSRTSAANLGALSWQTFGVGTETPTQKDGEANHPGIQNLQTGVTSGDDCDMIGSSSAILNTFSSGDTFDMTWIVRPQTITSVQMRIGAFLNASSNSEETNENCSFLFDPATSANWRCRTRSSGGTDQSTTTGTAVTSAQWYKLRIIKDGSTFRFLIDDVNVANHSTQIPTGAVTPAVTVDTGAAAAKDIDVDYFYLRLISTRS